MIPTYVRNIRKLVLGLCTFALLLSLISPAVTVGAATVPQAKNTPLTTPNLKNDKDFYIGNSLVWFDNTACSTATPVDSSTGASSGGGCGTNKNANKENEDQAWGFLTSKFKSKGYTDEEAKKAASGVMGNWQQESAWNSYRQDGQGCAGNSQYGINGWGIAQWCGNRVANLKSFAADKGKDWTCLGVQLDFMWQEMGSFEKSSQIFQKMKGQSPGDAGNTFDRIFEGSDGSGERAAKAEAYYKKRTGQSGGTSVQAVSDTTGTDDSSGSGASQGCINEEVADDTSIPAAECAPLVAEVKKLRDEGKFSSINGNANLDKDLANCTEGPIQCGTGSGKGGVTPQLLRAFVAVVKHVDSKKLGKIDIASMNTGHPCDGLMHPNGKAVDFWNCYNLNTDAKCREIFTYIADNAGSLGVKQVIHDAPPNGYTCGQKNILCLSDHNNEIHMGM